MSDIVWETTHFVDAKVSPQFAFAYMANVANWIDPPATFEMDGPFAAGTRGRTMMPGQETREWRLREVVDGKSYVLEMPLDGAALAFEWRFDECLRGARLRQHIVLTGEKAGDYVEPISAAFANNLAAGMIKVAEAMEKSAADARS